MAKKKEDEISLVDAIDAILKEADEVRQADPKKIFWVPTGCSLLDYAIGGGGWPAGRIVELYGSEGSGKTMFAVMAAKNVLKMGGEVYYIDVEHGLSPQWAAKLGMDLNRIVVRSPESLEAALAIMEVIAERRRNAENPTLIVWDSIAGSLSRKMGPDERDILTDDPQPGVEAKTINWFFRRGILRVIKHSRIVFLAINQTRDRIGIMYGEKETTPGGRSIRFFASLRVKLRKGEKIKNAANTRIGDWHHIEITKNRFDRLRSLEIPVYCSMGFDNIMNVIHFLKFKKIIKTGGASLTFQGQGYRGTAGLREAFMKDPKLFALAKEEAKTYLIQEDE